MAVIAGLGEKSDFVAAVPQVDPTKLNLTPDERELFERVGRAAQISSLITASAHPEARTIALLLSLRAKGAVVPAKVQAANGSSVPTAAAALNEDVELTEERKRDILEMEVALETKNHFEVFGVPSNVSNDDLKRAFYELSRKYHPDRYFKKNLGSFRARVELVYRKLSQAYELMSDPDRRAAYLRTHPLTFANEPLRAAPVTARPAAPRVRTDDDDARDAERRSRLAKHPYFAKGARLSELIARGKEHMGKGDYGHAFTQLHMAHQIDPENEDVNKMLSVVRAKNDAARAQGELQRGMEALEQGSEPTALSAFRSASNIDPKNSKAAYMCAKLIWDRGEAKEAMNFAQKSVDADPRNPEAHVLLARIMDANNMKAMSKKHFEEALKLDPKNAEAKKHVKGRWPF